MQEYIRKILGSGKYLLDSPLYNTTLYISNDEMECITKTVKSRRDSGLSLKGISETIQNEAKEQKGGFLNMLLGTLDARLLGNILAGKGVIRAGYGNKKGKKIVRVGHGNDTGF